MARDNRQILINPHSSTPKVPVGALNLGEIAVQHDSVSGAALYVETVADSQVASTVAKFINETAVNTLINNAKDDLQIKIDSINEQVGLPHSGTTGDTHHWDENTTVWEAIEETYAEMAAGTAAANTKVEKAANPDTSKYMTLTHVADQETSSITYTIGLQKIDETIESAYTIVNEKVEALSAETIEKFEDVEEKIEELSAATESALENLDSTGVTPNGQAIVNVTEENGIVTPVQGDIQAAHVTVADAGGLLTASTVEDALQEIAEKVEANEVESQDGTIIVEPTSGKTDLSVNIDGTTLVKDADGVLSADLKLIKETENLEANVREQYKLVYGDSTTAIGEVIKIYKDSSLYSAFLGHVDDVLSDDEDPTSVVGGSGDTSLDLIYHKEDGTYELVAIDVNDFLEESEFKDGLEVDNHVVKVKVDDESEEVVIGESGETAPVLSVSENGVKISNIQAAIDYAVEALAQKVDADVSDVSSDGRVMVEVVQEDAALTQVVVTTTDIASSEAVGLNEDGSFTPDAESNYASAATSVRNEIKLIDQALKEVSQKLNAASVVEGESTDNWVALTVEPTSEEGTTAITIDDTALAEELINIHSEIADEAAEREAADAELLGNSASTSTENSIMGLRQLISELATTLVKDVTVESGETLLEVTKEDTPEGDLYTIKSSDRLNIAVEAAETAVQDIDFAAVATKNETVYGSNAGAEVVDGTINLDLSTLRIDCGEY